MALRHEISAPVISLFRAVQEVVSAGVRAGHFFERLAMRFFQNTPQGEIMAYATNDIDAVRFFIGPSIMYSADTITTFIAAFGFMLAISPTLALLTVVPLPLMSLAVYLIGRRVH